FLTIGANQCLIYDNTLASDIDATGIDFYNSMGSDVRNNIFSNVGYPIYTPSGTSIATSNNNAYLGVVNMGNFDTYSSWQTQGYEVDSGVGDQMFGSDLRPLGASPIIGKGATLTPANIPALDVDRGGVARPAAGAWDIGAYQYCMGP